MSKNYAITRIKKHTNLNATSYLVNHHLRLVEVSNADPRRAHRNEVLIQKDDIVGFIADTPAGSKRNACRLVDVVFAGSQFKDKKHLKEWQTATLEFAKKEFGAENIALAVVHNDETTPHMHVIFKPVNPKTKKLGASHWFDGVLKMKSYQDRYHKAVAPLGFERGDPEKRANHKTLKAFYRDLANAEKQYKSFVGGLVAISDEIKTVSLWERLNPMNFKDRILEQLRGVANAAKPVLMAKEVFGTKKVLEDNKKLTEQVHNLEEKLQKLTGIEHPTWADIRPLADLLKEATEKQAELDRYATPTPPKPQPEDQWKPKKKTGLRL